MKLVTLPILGIKFSEAKGMSIVTAKFGEREVTLFPKGDHSDRKSTLVSCRLNEVGDKFVALSDSKTLDPTTKKPIFLKGETVTRQAESWEHISFAGEGQAAQFAQAASAFGLTLNVVMS